MSKIDAKYLLSNDNAVEQREGRRKIDRVVNINIIYVAQVHFSFSHIPVSNLTQNISSSLVRMTDVAEAIRGEPFNFCGGGRQKLHHPRLDD